MCTCARTLHDCTHWINGLEQSCARVIVVSKRVFGTADDTGGMHATSCVCMREMNVIQSNELSKRLSCSNY